MKLLWKQKDFNSDLDFILFHQKDGTPVWWQKQLFMVYPDLNYEYAMSLSEEKRFQYISGQMKIQAQKRQPIIDNAIKEFSKNWDSISNKVETAFTQAFDNDCSNILNNMVAYVGLNPICPRDVENHSFDIYHYFEPTYAITTALHEITHFVWFYFWNKLFKDSPSEYDFPNIKWLLSEIVVETIIGNSDISDLSEQIERLKKMTIHEIYELKNVIDTVSNFYAENLTDYALINGNHQLENLSSREEKMYQERRKYQNASSILMEVLKEKLDEFIC